MSFSNGDGPTVVIASGQTKSPAMVNDYTISDVEQLVIKSPDTLPEATPTIELSYDFNKNYLRDGQTLAAATAAATWETVLADGTANAIGLAGLPKMFTGAQLIANAWRLSLGGAAGADRSFKTLKRAPIFNM